MTASPWLHRGFISLSHTDIEPHIGVQVMNVLGRFRTENPEDGGDQELRGPNLALLSVALAFATTIFVAAAGAFPPDPYSTMLWLVLAAALFAVLKP
jgi:hypothetical protein